MALLLSVIFIVVESSDCTYYKKSGDSQTLTFMTRLVEYIDFAAERDSGPART